MNNPKSESILQEDILNESCNDKNILSKKYKITQYPADKSLFELHRMYTNGDLIVPKYFQRRYVWDINRASALIESFILGLPVPGIFLYLQNDGKYLIIDGQQRILSIVMFIDGLFKGRKFEQGVEFALRDVTKELSNKTYRTLLDNDRRFLENSILRATVVQQIEPDDHESIFHIFERLNTGGVNLNEMQIRMCVYHGKIMEFLQECNTNKEWRSIINEDSEDIFFFDIELILRLFALSECMSVYKSPMKKFLNKYCDELLNKKKDYKYELFKQIINETDWIRSKTALFSQYITDINTIGKNIFFIKGNKFSLAIFDAISIAIMQIRMSNTNYTISANINTQTFQNDNEFMEAVQVKYNTAGKENIEKRVEEARRILNA